MSLITDLLAKIAPPPKRLTWDYRVVQYETGQYHIREVYYTDGEPLSWCVPDACPYDYYDNYDELKDDLEAMLRAFDRPMLTVVDGKILRSGEAQGDD